MKDCKITVCIHPEGQECYGLGDDRVHCRVLRDAQYPKGRVCPFFKPANEVDTDAIEQACAAYYERKCECV